MAEGKVHDNDRLNHFFQTQSQRYEKCLEPGMLCQSKPIKAHSIQNARVLELIATDGHLVMPRQSFSKDGPQIEFSKVGRNGATTFTGLCGYHDREIFRPIDTQEIEIDNLEQLFLLAYRSVTREFHAVLEGAMRIQTSYSWQVGKGLLPGDKPSPAGIAATGHMLQAWETWKYRNKFYDAPYLVGDWKSLRHKVIVLDEQHPVIAVSTLFSFHPDSGKSNVLRCALNVFPLSQDRMVVVFTCAKPDFRFVYRKLQPILRSSGEVQKIKLSKLILENVENFVISPSHYEAWSEEKRRVVREAFVSTMFEPIDNRDDILLGLF